MRRLAPLALACCVLAYATTANAQARQAAPEQRAVQNITLDAFVQAVRADAERRGIYLNAQTAIEEMFRAHDTNGNGVLEPSEQRTRAQGPRSCTGAGVCLHGACYCIAASAEGNDTDVESVTADNPLFQATPEAQQNVLSD